jgi:anti-anti-sigma factor
MATARSSRAYWGHCDQSPILVLKGQFRYLTAWALRSSIDSLLAQEPCDTVIIDLRELESIDSTGMGLLAHMGRIALQHGRRAVIVCAVKDVMTYLQSAGFDTLFLLVEKWPFEEEAKVSEVDLDQGDLIPDIMGRMILDAHRELASLSEQNRQTFGGVISELESDLERPSRS